jgi:hypothetical protein
MDEQARKYQLGDIQMTVILHSYHNQDYLPHSQLLCKLFFILSEIKPGVTNAQIWTVLLAVIL